MKLIDLDQTIFVPIVDESKGGVTYEMQMTVEQFFRRFFSEVPPIIDAIPVEWLKVQNNSTEYFKTVQGQAVELILELWQKEQEAQK